MQYEPGFSDLLPVVVGFVTWVLCLAILTDPLRSAERARRHAEEADVRGRRAAASSSAPA